jgi:hypothetical protein
MPNLVIPADSEIYLHADVTAPWDPTTDLVDGSLLPLGAGDPQPSDWQPADWTPGFPATPRLLYPGTSVPGAYWLRFRLHDSPETPVLTSGVVVLT